ncbi:NAD(+) diphosphatase [Stappia sp. F7233]|uniref:NAD(+) diphosphatase n=1 Tax=Stappia albiluteola TaxID=2758565 RepID=A0A839AAQ8_9HYPH|nr:NAD(+) diphosphatase [Stappia albiluteola]MBA5776114.1 NAD(+) diphosphatase [Stappia albiluteola]
MNFQDIPPQLSDGFSYAGNRLERLSEHRGDARWLAEHMNSPAARFVCFCSEKPVINLGEGGKGPLTSLHERALGARFGMVDVETVLLGFERESRSPIFATSLPAGEEEIEAAGPLKLIDIRSLAIQGALSPEELGILAQARALSHWHSTHRFCSRCGHESRMTQGGYRRDCPQCGGLHFPRTDPVAIMLIADGENCLMGRTPRLAEAVFSTLAGFIEPGETVEDAVRREVFEEAGVQVGRVGYRASQPWPFPASLMIGCRGEALSRDIVMDETELEACRWFSRAEVLDMLAGTHAAGLRVPPPLSIAHWLIREWALGRE